MVMKITATKTNKFKLAELDQIRHLRCDLLRNINFFGKCCGQHGLASLTSRP